MLLYICMTEGTRGMDWVLSERVEPRIVGDGDISRGGMEPE
jgi:hypothetical protein